MEARGFFEGVNTEEITLVKPMGSWVAGSGAPENMSTWVRQSRRREKKLTSDKTKEKQREKYTNKHVEQDKVDHAPSSFITDTQK